MSNKSGTSSQVITLPSGGGALAGIGESFAPDLHTGTGNFTVPIALPPGRQGLAPRLTLTYSTGNPGGPFGLGWGLSVPSVRRKTSRGVPRYRDGDPATPPDTFLLSGAEDLVPVGNPSAGVTRYRPRTEGLFALIDRHHSADDDYWRVRSKDGLTSLYGTPGAGGADPAAVANPARRSDVCAWMLSRTEDPFGNHIRYDYLRDSDQPALRDPALGAPDAAQVGAHHWDQLYLRQIRYVDHDAAAGGYLVSVTLQYAERPDPFSTYRCGFEIRTRLRCTAIEVRTHADDAQLARVYHLIYADQRPELAGQLPANGVSLLSQVVLVGHTSEDTQELPPLSFGYTRFEPAAQRFAPIGGSELPARSLASPDIEVADLFGNGLPDLIELSGTARYWRNLGAGRFDLPRMMRDAPAGLTLADPSVQLIDADGDGRIDLLAQQNGLAGYFPLRSDGVWDRRSFQAQRVAPSFSLADPEVRLVDLDGDGVTDAIRSGARLECFFNDPEQGWGETRQVARRNLADFPNLSFADPRVRWADMAGDGLQDIVLVYDGSVAYWPNMGYGNWGRRIEMRNSPRLPFGYDPRRVLLGDLDGDGLADMVYVDQGHVTLWINRSGNSWSDPIVIAGTPPVSDIDAVRLIDLLGSGVAGILWSADATLPGRDHMFFLDLTGGTKPYLLDRMDNQIGALTRVEYATSTHFFQADQADPATRWQTALPFPLLVVARVEVVDGVSGGKLTTEYRYHNGYWDGVEREFRGFGMVEQLDTESFARYNGPGLHGDAPSAPVAREHYTPPTLTKTWFHQGPIGGAADWREADDRGRYWAGDPPALDGLRPGLGQILGASIPLQARRDALRALRGSVLRSELYALDGSARAGRPYTVSEAQYDVREEQAPGEDDPERRRIFFPHPVARRHTQWERGAEPMTRFSFGGDYDTFGQPQRQVSLAVPRGRDDRAAAPAGAPYLGTLTTMSYARPDDQEQRYIVDRVAARTTHEIVNDGSQALLELYKAACDGAAELSAPIAQACTYYDGVAFAGLPLGQIGAYGATVRVERLALSEDIRDAAYGAAPPYLTPGAAPDWGAEYPQAFRRLPALAGYRFADGSGRRARGYFVQAGQTAYDFQRGPADAARGLAVATRDPLGHETTIAHDRFALLPARVADPAGMVTTAAYDERVLQPRLVIDPNGNRSEFRFTPLGLLQAVFVRGKDDSEGDRDRPSTRFVHDFEAFAAAGQPIAVRTIKQEHHDTESDVALPERDATIETVEYSDGFGRLIQTRTQAEDLRFGDESFGNGTLPADQTDRAGSTQTVIGRQNTDADAPNVNVIVSGWQVYDNKGRVVAKYEPFFDQGWAYDPPADARLGQRATMFYDPRGRVIRTQRPDGAEQRVVFGVPADLADPEHYAPTPWESYTYDANDNAGRTHPNRALAYAGHWNTPASAVVDALGRTIETTARNGPQAQSWLTTRSAYDIRGNLLSVTDPLGRVAFRYVYDLLPAGQDAPGRVLRVEQIDSGVRSSVFDAAGNLIEQRDAKGGLILRAYDTLRRPARVWARDDSQSGGAVTLREALVYGDDPAAGLVDPTAQNLRGRLYQHYDEAGRLTCASYDFKGNLRVKARQVIADAAILAVFPAQGDAGWDIQPFRVDWQPAGVAAPAERAPALLDPAEYRTTMRYDALGRIKTMQCPRDVTGARKLLRPHYNRAGALERVTLDGAVYVAQIAYNARGQRTLIARGNGVLTRYAYDPFTFRLARMRSERYTRPDAQSFAPDGGLLQDCAYVYDLAGNLLAIHDRVPGCGVDPQPDTLDRAFGYDPLYRLTSTTGRECRNLARPAPWADDPQRCGFNSGNHGAPNQANAPALTDLYEQTYAYDDAGNLRALRHSGGAGAFVRQLNLAANTNRLEQLQFGQRILAYQYDDAGNLLRETSSRHFAWDHSDRMKAFRTQAGDAEPSLYAHYLYDGTGQRVKKLLRRQGGGVTTTIYIDGVFEHQRWGADEREQNNRLHVVDDQKRIAVVRIGPASPGDKGPAVQYHLGDHLGSSGVVADAGGDFVNREEYTPYGETSFGGFARKRYRFSGKERDEESGLNYHGARYYAPWLGRWASCDPAGRRAGINPYTYGASNPIRLVDPSGLQPVVPTDPELQTARSPFGESSIPPPADNDSAEPSGPALQINFGATQEGRKIHGSLQVLDVGGPGKPAAGKPDAADRTHAADSGLKTISLAQDILTTFNFKYSALESMLTREGSSFAQNFAVSGSRSLKAFSGITNSLGFAGALLGAVGQYITSPAQTSVGRYADVALSTVVQKAVGPVVGVVDLILTHVSGGKLSLSQHLGASSHAIVTLGESLIIGIKDGFRNAPLRGLQQLRKRLLAGEGGWAMQQAIQAGDYWAEYGIVGGISRFFDAVLSPAGEREPSDAEMGGHINVNTPHGDLVTPSGMRIPFE